MRRASPGSVAFVALTLTLIVGGCGNGGDGAASPSPTATTTVTVLPTAVATETVTPLPTPTLTSTPSLTNVRALHDPTSRRYDADCLKCHGDVLDEQTLSPEVPGIHPVMLPLFGGAANAACVQCHESVDFDNRSAGNVRRDVRVEKCALCHSVGYPGQKYYYFDE